MLKFKLGARCVLMMSAFTGGAEAVALLFETGGAAIGNGAPTTITGFTEHPELSVAMINRS